jgi:shikimate dehydrogenase
MIEGSTRLVAIVGSPVAQVKMPGTMNRYFAEQGLDLALVPFDVPPAGIASFIALLKQGRNLLGSIVTVPHKQAMAAGADFITERARTIGAVNVVRRDADGHLHGDHVDGFGFLNAARAHGFHPRGRAALVVGVGGAGGAIACALCEVGIARLVLIDRDAARVQDLGAKLRAQFPQVQIDDHCDTLAGLDLIAQATPMGMQPGDALPLPPALLDTLTAETLVGDAITVPAITPLLALAQARGCRVQTGLEMSRASMEFLGGFLGVMPAVDPAALVAAPLP